MSLYNSISIYSQKLEENEFIRIQSFMLENLGVKLSPIKIVMVNSRLLKRLRDTQISSFKEYLDYALSDEGKAKGERQKMIDELTTHKTEFFREADHYDFLKNEILPNLSGTGLKFKIWSAGCSTGEEPFTMGMILNDFKILHKNFDFEIHASDVSTGTLEKAVKAVYNENTILTLDEQLIRRYFLRSKDRTELKVRVSKELRDKVNFFALNLVDNYPFPNNSFDVIFCRNTLIYFEDKAKRDVVKRLIDKVKIGGYFFVGLSETVTQYSTQIKQVKPSVYVKIN